MASQATPTPTPTPTWVWDSTHSLYYSPELGSYAYTNPTTGEWHYIPASSLASSSSTIQAAPALGIEAKDGEKEDGEIEDDVGWGGLMEPEELDRALKSNEKGREAMKSNSIAWSDQKEKHPIYGVNNSSSRNSRLSSSSPPKETPNHLLRLVVISSPSLQEGHVAIIDTREGGIQLGRDRCEKSGHPRIRVKEMEVSKTHAVVYWGVGTGKEGDDEEGWWVVDMGSTHGTFVASNEETTSSSKSAARGHRLSTPKTASLPHALLHLSTLTIGQTIFEIHNHPQWPCDECQLGRNNEIQIDTGAPTVPSVSEPAHVPGEGYAMNSSERRENREVKRKREMAALKNSLLNRVSTNSATDDSSDKRQYLDRSAIRRHLHPKSPPKSDVSKDTRDEAPTQSQGQAAGPAPVSSFAQNMLAAQGWAPGAGLGKDKSGRSEAIEVKMRIEKRGLGAKGAEIAVEEGTSEGGNEDWRKKGRVRRFDEMKGW